MWVMITVLVVLFFSMIAVVIAVVVSMRNTRKINNIEEVSIRAEVIGDKQGMKLYDPHKLGNHRSSIVFKTDKGQYIRLNVKQKDYSRLSAGQYGELTYHANNLLSFKRLRGHEEARLEEKLAQEQEAIFNQKSHVYMSADMIDINVQIPSDIPQSVTKMDVYDIVDQIYDCVHENFFVLDDGSQVIQFMNDGKSEHITIDIPAVKQGGSYQKVLHDIYIVKEIVDKFFSGIDIATYYNLEFEQF